MDTWVPVLVRLQDVERVMSLLVEWESQRASEPGLAGVEVATPSESPNGGVRQASSLSRPSWSLEDLRRLARGSTATTERWSRAMDVCSEAPGHFFSTSEVAARAGMTVAQWRDAPRKISRHLKAHFPDVPREENGHAVWPLLARSVPENPGEVSWTITDEMASLWLEARRG